MFSPSSRVSIVYVTEVEGGGFEMFNLTNQTMVHGLDKILSAPKTCKGHDVF